MRRQDWKRRLKSLQDTLGSSRPKDQDGASGSYSAEPQKYHANSRLNASTIEDGRSSKDSLHSDQASQTQTNVVPVGQLLSSSHTLTTPRIDNAPIQDLWNIAYEKLRVEDNELIKKYEMKLQGNMVAGLGSTLGSNASIRDRMQMILENKMNEVNSNTWKLKFRSSEVEVRDLVQPILGIVSLVNEYITDAVSVSSYASFAWVGISLLLPLFLNPSTQMASLAKGLEFVSTLIAQSRMREELYVRRYELKPSEGQSFQQSHREYKIGLEQLYRQILKFQVTTYCYFTKDSASRLCLDITKRNDWGHLIDEIREQDTLFAKLATSWRDIQYDDECLAAENRHQKAMSLWFAIGENVSSLARAVKDAHEQKDRIELLRWLCNIDHTELYNGARGKHKGGTGEWLLDRSETFKAWEESMISKSFLWLHGKAGSGKSILSSSVIKHLQDRQKGNSMTVLAYFYFSFSDTQKQKVDVMLASLIKQISAHRPYIPQSVQSLGEYKNNGGRPDTETLIEALISSIQGFSAVYIIIDALDECPTLNGERKRLLNSLRDILNAAPDSLHMLCTSRKENDIDKAIRPLLCDPWGAEIDLSVQRKVLDDDIGKYIDSILADAEYDTWPTDIKKESRNALIDKADGMFQYVRCQFENLQNLSSEDAIRRALGDLPSGLDSTYDRMLLSIDTNFQPQVIASLKWLAFSIGPLNLDQLAEIFMLPSKSDDGFDNMSRLFSSIDVLKYFPGLVVTEDPGLVVTMGGLINGAFHVRLAHFSIKEYLTSDRILQSRSSVFAFTEADAHVHIGRFCLAYHLHISSTTEIPNENGKIYSLRPKQDLAEYARIGWAKHIEFIPRASWPPEISRNAVLALSVCSKSLFRMIYRLTTSQDFIRQPCLYTAMCGFRQLTEMFISSSVGVGRYLTQVDVDEGLSWATSSRRKAVVKLFLDKGAQIHDCLEIAARRGDAAIVGLLLDHGAEIPALAGKLASTLRSALWGGHLDVLKLLVNRGADVNSPFDKTEYMPHLEYTPHPGSFLVNNLDLHIVDCLRFLFDSGAGVNMKDGTSLAAALYVAIHVGARRAFQLLLDRGAHMNELAGEKGYPLQAAIDSIGDAVFIKDLLDRGADPNAQGGIYNTALQFACVNISAHKSEKMIQIIELLVNGGADVSIQGGKYGTAIQAACYNRNMPIAAAKYLLEKGADVNVQGGHYGNALQAACQRNSASVNKDFELQVREHTLEIVQLLLDHGADVHAEGGYYGTALQAACAREYEDVVHLLIDRGVNVNAQGGRYGTALQAACATGNLTIVYLLLKKGARVNIEAGYHGTALEAACARSHTQVARALLEHGADVHLGSNGAWYAAALSQDDDLVKLLLDHGAAMSDSRSSHSSPLHALLQHRRRLLHALLRQRRLLKRNINVQQEEEDVDELDAYVEIGRYDSKWINRVKLLLKHGADPNLEVGKYGTALQAACTVKAVVPYAFGRDMYYGTAGPKLLLELCPSIDVNVPGGLFGSALQAAAYSGQTPTIGLLLSRGARVNARGGRYGSALNAAVIAGNWDIVEVLLDAGATPDCHILSEPDEEWLQRVLEDEDDGQGGVERYRKFWEVEKAEREVLAN
ncbi:ankyrin repeat-containing domain protein [Trichoderma camerunense]